MNYVKLKYNGRSYDYNGSDNIAMDIVGQFLLSDVGCYGDVYRAWALNPAHLNANGNLIALEKDADNRIHLTDMYNQSTDSASVVLNIDEFVQLLDNWQDKICKNRPKEAIVKQINNQFFIETQE